MVMDVEDLRENDECEIEIAKFVEIKEEPVQQMGEPLGVPPMPQPSSQAQNQSQTHSQTQPASEPQPQLPQSQGQAQVQQQAPESQPQHLQSQVQAQVQQQAPEPQPQAQPAAPRLQPPGPAAESQSKLQTPQLLFPPKPPSQHLGLNGSQNRLRAIKIGLVPQDGSSIIDILCSPRLQVIRLMEIYASQKWLKCPNSLRLFAPNGWLMDSQKTLDSYNIEDGDLIDVTLQQTGGKPVILLYPEEDNTSLDVDVQLCPAWDLSAVYPTGSLHDRLARSKSRLEDLGERHVSWSVTADRCGSLTDNATQRRYEYLFWEAKTNCRSSGAVGKSLFSLDTSRAFCVSRAEIGSWLDDALERYGLNTRERNDCVTYWLHDLEDHAWVLVQFLDEAEYAAAAKLTITPTPDELIRVFFVFRGVDERVEGCGGAFPTSVKARHGFVAVEWGAMNLLV